MHLSPSQIAEDRFFARIEEAVASGFRIGIVNYVMTRENIDAYAERKRRADEIGIILHPNPLFNSAGKYKDDDMTLLRKELLPLDFEYRTQTTSPQGKLCRFPMLAYEMDLAGNIIVGWHAGIRGSLFDEALPSLMTSSVPCPHSGCVCLDKYSFLDGVDRNVSLDPLAEYAKKIHADRYRAQLGEDRDFL